MKIVLEMRYYVGRGGSVIVSGTCKAPGCRGTAFSGDIEAVLAGLAGHLMAHEADFSKKKIPWAQLGAPMSPAAKIEE